MALSAEDRKLLEQVAAYFEVWVNLSQDPSLIELASKFRRADSAIHSRRFRRLKDKGLVSTEGRNIIGGGVAFPLTDKGKEVLAS